MIFDATTKFSDSQAITGDAVSTNVIDLGATGTPFGEAGALVRDVGKTSPPVVVIQIETAFDNLTSLDVAIEIDTAEGFGSATSVQSQNYLLAELTAGKMLEIPCHLPEGTNERYVRLNYNVNGTNPTAGTITAGIVAGRQTNA